MTISGRHVAIGLVAFFGFVSLVNGVMIYFAVDQFPGLETTDSYRRGLAYNDVLKNAEVLDRRGWVTSIEHFSDGESGLVISLAVKENNGRPARISDVVGTLKRPVHDSADQIQVFRFSESGLYQARFSDVDAGQWRLSIVAQTADGDQYRAESRLWLN